MHMSAERCPRCRAAATYVGLERLECPTPECPNYGGEDEAGEQLWLELPVRRVDERPTLPLG